MSIELLSLIAGALLSLAFSYVPGLKEKWQPLSEEHKRAYMALMLLVTAAALLGLSCAGWLEQLWPGLGISCSQEGALALVRIFIMAMVSNQATFRLSKPAAKPDEQAVS